MHIIKIKRAISARYRALLTGLDIVFPSLGKDVASAEWLTTLLLPGTVERDQVIGDLLEHGVETRPVFHCLHEMPVYRAEIGLPVSVDVARRGLSLPSYPGLTDDEQSWVVQSLAGALNSGKRR